MTIEDLWHQRSIHINFNDFKLLQKQGMVNGILVLNNVHVGCEACGLVKMHKDEFPIDLERKRDILEIVHTNLCGPSQTRSFGCAYYLFMIV